MRSPATPKLRRRPTLLVYRRTRIPSLPLDDKELPDRLKQKLALDGFVEKTFRNPDGSFKAAFNPYDGPAEFEEKLEEHLRKWLAAWLDSQEGAAAGAFRAPVPPGSCALPRPEGVRHRASADLFRANRANQCRPGPAPPPGRRRTSIRAGNRQERMRQVVARPGRRPPPADYPGRRRAVDLWRCTAFRPSELVVASSGANAAFDLFDVLAAALLRKEALPELVAAGTAPATLAAMLRTSPSAIGAPVMSGLTLAADAYRRAKNLERPPEARLALVVDQLEEIFTLTQVTSGDRRKFIEALAVLARGGQAYVLATLRADFLPRCADLPELIALRAGDGLFDLMPPSADEIGQMIRMPVAVSALRFDRVEGRGTLDDVLRDEAVKSPENLPLLEYALDELYERRSGNLLTFAAYDELGGILGLPPPGRGHLRRSLNRSRSALPAAALALVKVGGEDEGKPTRRFAPLSALEQPPALAEFVAKFVGARLFVADKKDDGPPIVHLAHEVLVTGWHRLSDWYAEHRAALRSRDRVESDAHEWQGKGEPADLLLPDGTRLREGEDLLSAGFPDLDPLVPKFVQASRRKAKLGTHVWQIVTGIFLALFVASGIAAYFAYNQRTRATAPKPRRPCVPSPPSP